MKFLGLGFLKSCLVQWLMADDETREYSLCDYERLKYEVRPCDVLLVEGRSRVSEIIKMVTQSPWSHASLYIGKLHDFVNPSLRNRIEKHYQGDPSKQLIIESELGRGTIVESIDKFKDYHVRICRPIGILPSDAEQVLVYAISRLGLDYDTRQIIDLLRYLLPWNILPRRLRSSLFTHKPGVATKQICSTMIGESFAKINFPILPVIKKSKEKGIEFIRRNPRLLTPSDFDYSPYFDIVKYPLFEVFGQAPYRDLPWNQEGILSNDNGAFFNPKDHQPKDEE